ncbi:hypothetical protein ACM66B_001968 [Microbotryomycetes sp. NB124-2]
MHGPGTTADSTPTVPPLPVAKDSPYAAVESTFQQEAAFLPRSALLQPSTQPQRPLTDVPDAGHSATDDGTELYIPGLTSITLFTDLPSSDSVAVLVEKYIPAQNRPPRDLSGAWQGQTLDELISARKWRAIASYCHDTILDSSPEQTSYLLSLWCLRLHAILRLRLVEHFVAEVSALIALLPDPPPGHEFHSVVPFELRVYQISVLTLRGNAKAAVVEYSYLTKACKAQMWAAEAASDKDKARMWLRRADRIAGMLCSAMQDMQAHASCLNQLRCRSDEPLSSKVLPALTRFHVSTGDVIAAQRIVELADGSASSVEARKARVLACAGSGSWAEAEKELRVLVNANPQDLESRSNLAVVLLFMSRLQDAIQVYHELINDLPDAAFASETVLFNLATLLELRTEAATAGKIRLLSGVAERGAEGLRAGCLKLIL